MPHTQINENEGLRAGSVHVPRADRSAAAAAPDSWLEAEAAITDSLSKLWRHVDRQAREIEALKQQLSGQHKQIRQLSSEIERARR